MTKINNYFKNKLNSFILVPLLLSNIATPNLANNTEGQEISKEGISLNLQIFKDLKAPVEIVDSRAAKIDAYFAQWDLPLAGYGEEMVAAADMYGIDWRLLPALAKLETTGGKNLCKNPKATFNPFGYGSCTIGFDSFEESFYAVAKTLSGNGKNTSHLYKGKSIEEILEVYNPPATPGITKNYHGKALKVMEDIGNMQVDASFLAKA
jgi:hypothetical protein